MTRLLFGELQRAREPVPVKTISLGEVQKVVWHARIRAGGNDIPRERRHALLHLLSVCLFESGDHGVQGVKHVRSFVRLDDKDKLQTGKKEWFHLAEQPYIKMPPCPPDSSRQYLGTPTFVVSNPAPGRGKADR